MKYQLIHFRSQSLLACFAAASLMTRVAAAEVFINFDAHADGTPFSGQYGQIAFTEYASLGLTLSTIGSQNSMANVIASNPANVGSPFSGFGLSASFPGTGGAVSIFLRFATPVQSLSFDFNATGGTLLVAGDRPTGERVFNASLPANQPFIDVFGTGSGAGSAAFTFSEPLRTVVLGLPTTYGLIGMDNLRFTPVPEPSTWALLLLGAASLGFTLRRRPM